MGIDGGKPHLDSFGRRKAESGPSFCVRTFVACPVLTWTYGESKLSPITVASTAASNDPAHAVPSPPVRVHAASYCCGHVVIKSCPVGARRAHGGAPRGTRDNDRMQRSDGTRDTTSLPGAWAT